MIITFKNVNYELFDWKPIKHLPREPNYGFNWVRRMSSSEYDRCIIYTDGKYSTRNSNDKFYHTVAFGGVLAELEGVYESIFKTLNLYNLTPEDSKNHVDNFLLHKLKLTAFI